MIQIVEVPVVDSPFPYMDKEQCLYTRTSVPAGTSCCCCGIDIAEDTQDVFKDVSDNYYCPTEIKVVMWYDLWLAYEHPALDCVSKGVWFQITDGTEPYSTRMRIMINNQDAKNTRVLDFSHSSWIAFFKGMSLANDLLHIKSQRNDHGMICVSSMDNDKLLVSR